MSAHYCEETPSRKHEGEENQDPRCLKDLGEMSAEISRLRRLLVITVATLLLVLFVLCILVIAIGVGVLVETE